MSKIVAKCRRGHLCIVEQSGPACRYDCLFFSCSLTCYLHNFIHRRLGLCMSMKSPVFCLQRRSSWFEVYSRSHVSIHFQHVPRSSWPSTSYKKQPLQTFSNETIVIYNLLQWKTQLAQGCYTAFAPSSVWTQTCWSQVQRFTRCATPLYSKKPKDSE